MYLPHVHALTANSSTYATYVVYDPTVTDVTHKALYCPKHHGLSTSLTASGLTIKKFKPKSLIQV